MVAVEGSRQEGRLRAASSRPPVVRTCAHSSARTHSLGAAPARRSSLDQVSSSLTGPCCSCRERWSSPLGPAAREHNQRAAPHPRRAHAQETDHSDAQAEAKGTPSQPVDNWTERKAEQTAAPVNRPGADTNEHPERVGADRTERVVAVPVGRPNGRSRWRRM